MPCLSDLNSARLKPFEQLFLEIEKDQRHVSHT